MNINHIVSNLKTDATKSTLVVIDLETGGLNFDTNKEEPSIKDGMIGAQSFPILEITAKFLDGNLKEIHPPKTFVINHEKDILMKTCSEWSKEAFADNLFVECEQSVISLAEAEQSIIDCIEKIGTSTNYLVGNSVGFDQSFINIQMPKLAKKLHYRIIDITAFKVFFNLLFGEAAQFHKKSTHRTEEDTKESIEELKFYCKHFIKSRNTVARDALTKWRS